MTDPHENLGKSTQQVHEGPARGGSRVRRILAEAEAHLRDEANNGKDQGLDRAEAQLEPSTV
jgi:hypothetical protein